MGRFDALTHIEETPKKPTPLPVTQFPTLKKSPAPPIKPKVEEKKPENLKSRKPEILPLIDGLLDKPEKYSTLLEPRLVKKIKIFSAEREIKDYQVIAQALTEYFERHQ